MPPAPLPLTIAACLLLLAHGWRIHIPWDTRDWCDQIQYPTWPYAYRKSPIQTFEEKGRTASNAQDFRHVCGTRGARSVCHRCEDIVCGEDARNLTCSFQLQGVQWAQLPPNIPTTNDVPFAVGPDVLHRHDFGNAEQVCLHTMGGDCIQHATSDFSECALRCWGQTYAPPVPFQHGWTYPRDEGLPQGRVFTLAGGGGPGFADGTGAAAAFNDPQGVAVDRDRNVYVSDTGNHAIRMVAPGGVVTTLAGTPGTAGLRDGVGTDTLFSSPTGITLLHDAAAGDRLTIYVADSGNHVIRRLRQEPPGGPWEVEVWAGGGTTQVDPVSPAGFQDGWRTEARFFQPRGIAVDDANNIFVADTMNHVVRHIAPDGTVALLAGTVVPLNATGNATGRPMALAGCPFPCLEGVSGYVDATRLASQFSFPQDVAISEEGTVLVADANRLRRVTRSVTNATSVIQGVSSFDRVVTLAGALDPGRIDGIGQEARFEQPKGVFMDAGGRVYVADALQCRLRRVTPADHVAQALSCSDRLVDVIRPSGCSLYDPPVDVLDKRATPLTDNIYSLRVQGGEESHRILRCVGTPPPDIGATSSGTFAGGGLGSSSGATGGGATGFTQITEKEQTDDGTELRFSCPPGCALEAVQASETPTQLTFVYGTDIYADISRVCAAAAHAGLITDAGGLVTVRVETGRGPLAANETALETDSYVATVRNDIASNFLEGWERSFSVHAYPLEYVEVYTMAGAPAARLHDACGYGDGQPPQEATFADPSALAMYRHTTLTDTDFLYVADAGNHAIRAVSAVCAKMCENGGRCVAAETCACPPGWAGADCTTPVCADGCGANEICVGNGTCACKPGYSGLACLVPLCVQDCVNGACSGPDTCTCNTGWFDANCTTPVCEATCGNGGNCTSPDVCTCPQEWTGFTCRVPVCANVLCVNGGSCVAPDTCQCPYGWSGHDCSKPMCTQGFLRADPVPHHFAPPSLNDTDPLRPLTWRQYLPCEFDEWCDATNEFDCRQEQRGVPGAAWDPDRSVTGFQAWGSPDPGGCFSLELPVDFETWYRYEPGDGTISPYRRLSSDNGYDALSIFEGAPAPWASPTAGSAVDRSVALVQYLNVTQGVYVCANGGNCTEPDLCVCAPGWVGFDCRTPVCTQGWYNPRLQPRDPATGDVERWSHQRQGSYECSLRAVQLWENPDLTDHDDPVSGAVPKFTGYEHNHPNYFSRYMDDSRGWPHLHFLEDPLGNDTREGFRRDGWWNTTGNVFLKGDCLQEYLRVCPGDVNKTFDLEALRFSTPTDDQELSYAARVEVTVVSITAAGRWEEAGGECIDHVLNGCFNNGTCVAPGTCVCPPGWEGHDCSVPICSQSVAVVDALPGDVEPLTLIRADGVNVGDPAGSATPPDLPGDVRLQYRECPNAGNCTLPETCTCEKGWEGHNCTTPICAQECHHGGTCVAPDTCHCVTEWNAFVDGRGRPVFRKSNGDPQETGWTGYDCNTPICVQSERWLLNTAPAVTLLATSNEGVSFQAGCPNVTRFTPANRTRASTSLCFVGEWYQGSFDLSYANFLPGHPLASIDSAGRAVRSNFDNYVQLGREEWAAGPTVLGEGVHACHNLGSCVSPDACECQPGWSGFDCNSPLCRHVDVFGTTVGCLNGGVCGDRDECTCITQDSLLTTVHPEVHPLEPVVATGWTGTDCSIAICVQGFFNATCPGVATAPGAPNSGGEGCYLCANGGHCSAPDFCTCTEEWTGYDCRTPVCTLHADADIQAELDTVDAANVAAFELDPCGSEVLEEFQGRMVGRGNCSSPDTCTCFCRDRSWRDAQDNLVTTPWQDPLDGFRNVLGPGGIFGRYDCLDGWEGRLQVEGDLDTKFASCHLAIFVPTFIQRYTLLLIIIGLGVLVVGLIAWFFIRRKLKHRYLLAKAERRRSRRSSEEERARNAFTN